MIPTFSMEAMKAGLCCVAGAADAALAVLLMPLLLLAQGQPPAGRLLWPAGPATPT